MATKQEEQEHADWRARQKERERERRRMRDRQRRQSMSLEEREKHLARRRKNYQLRRQRAANAQLGLEQTNASNVPALESHSLNEGSLAIVCVSGVNVQSDRVMQDGFDINAYEKEDSRVMKYEAETELHYTTYAYPRIPRLSEIRKLARGLNSSVDKSCIGISPVNGADAEFVNSQRVHGRTVRLIHVKHLARALHSLPSKTSELNHMSDMRGQGNVNLGKNDQMTSEGTANFDGQSNYAS